MPQIIQYSNNKGGSCSGNSLSNVYHSSVFSHKWTNGQLNRGGCKFSASPKGTLTVTDAQLFVFYFFFSPSRDKCQSLFLVHFSNCRRKTPFVSSSYVRVGRLCSTAPEYNFEVHRLVFLNFVLLYTLHYILKSKYCTFTLIHLFDSFSCKLLYRFHAASVPV